mmetsp:Transcript_36112/g.115959  ORF Transcript_36112/g.115959 Transcript_36112/m.115959 type:complete len:218 (-) Transcript_36112:132-785(-)
MNDRVRGDDAVLSGVGLDHLEFDRPHAATDKKQVVLAHRAVSLQKVRLEEDIKQIAGDALDGVIYRQDVDALAVLDVRTLVDRDDVAEAHFKVLAHALIHANFAQVACVVGEHDANRVFPALSLDEHSVAPEELQLLHGLHIERDDRVVVIDSFVDDEAIRVLLLDRLDLSGRVGAHAGSYRQQECPNLRRQRCSVTKPGNSLRVRGGMRRRLCVVH